ncbi:transcriptional repressor MprA [compost metagenome]
MDFTSGAVTALCDKLEKKGLAERKRKENDRRTVWLEITVEGKAMLDRHRNIGTRSIMTLFDGMSPEQLEQQIALTTLIFNNLEHYAEALNQLAQDNEHNTGITPLELSLSEDVQPSENTQQSENASHTSKAARPNQYLSY